MEQNNDNYVLVLEDRTEVKNAQETGKLSVLAGYDKNGNLQMAEPKDSQQASFLQFNSDEGMFKSFMINFLRQFNDPMRFGLYKVVADNVEQGVIALAQRLQERHKPENKADLESCQVKFEDYLPVQKNATAIDPEKVDWKTFQSIGLTREQLEQNGMMDALLNWRKTDLTTIGIPLGNTTIYTEARLALRTDDSGNIGLAIHPIRKEPKLDYPYMGHTFTPEEKEQLLQTGNLGKTIEITPREGAPFAAYVSIDPQTNELVSLRADRVLVPQEIKGVTLTDDQHRQLSEGKAVLVQGMTARNGKKFDATLQINAEKKGIEFIFDPSKTFSERKEMNQNARQGVPYTLCGLELSEKQREALEGGRTLYLRNMTDRYGQTFNAYVKMDKEGNRPRFYKRNPDQVEAVAEENKTQVAVNNEGKTNEATKDVKEPLKSGQTQPDSGQKQEMEKKQEADKKQIAPARSKGRKM